MTTLDTVIVGAGQAGLGVSYFLQQNGRQHIVFEQGRIGESWLSQRWDSFKLNTPNFMNVLPGFHYDGLEPDGFWRSDELVHYFQRYVEQFQLPVRTGVTVVSVEQSEDEGYFIVKTNTLNDEAAAHVHFADNFSQRLKDNIDAYLLQSGIAPPPLKNDPADMSDPQAECGSSLRRLNLREAKVSTVIWATGFTSDFSWIHLPVLDAEGRPIYQRGISPVRGLYFIGFPWLSSRKSGIIYGIDEDAHYIADTISEQLA